MQRAQLLRTQRRASALDGVHTGLEEAHRLTVGEALRIRCHATQALHLHFVCAQRGVKALRGHRLPSLGRLRRASLGQPLAARSAKIYIRYDLI